MRIAGYGLNRSITDIAFPFVGIRCMRSKNT